MDMIEADTGNDAASTTGSSTYSSGDPSTASLRSSVYTYEVEHGRTYHSYHAGKYNLPNDAGEGERMDLHYHALRLTIEDKLFHAPLNKPEDVTAILDVGTGTGIWAMDAADAHPQAAVLGIDLSPIQPTWVPDNLQFEVCDADEDWTFGHNRFSLVHTRFMNGFSLKSWPHCYREAFRTLKPGGWIENQEFDFKYTTDDDTIPSDSSFRQWSELWCEGIEKLGATARCDPDKMVAQMIEAGFVNVEVKKYKMPATPWAKDAALKHAGLYQYLAVSEGLHGMSARVFTKGLGWSMDRLEALLAEVRTELKIPGIHGYWPTYVIFGQKPESAALESEPRASKE